MSNAPAPSDRAVRRAGQFELERGEGRPGRSARTRPRSPRYERTSSGSVPSGMVRTDRGALEPTSRRTTSSTWEAIFARSCVRYMRSLPTDGLAPAALPSLVRRHSSRRNPTRRTPELRARGHGCVHLRIGDAVPSRPAGNGAPAPAPAPSRPYGLVPFRAGAPRVVRAAREVLRQPGRGLEPRRTCYHLLRPLLKQTVSLPLPPRPRGRRARDRLGRADRRRPARRLDLLHAAGDLPEHRLVRASRVRDAPRPAPRLHARPGRRARRRSSSRRSATTAETSPFAPRQLEFDTSGYVQMELLGLDAREDE